MIDTIGPLKYHVVNSAARVVASNRRRGRRGESMQAQHAFFRNWPARCLASCAAPLAVAAAALAQQAAWDESAPPLQFPNVWIGTAPIQLEDLKGKAAILCFYEESCPKCRGRWPGMQAMAQKYADKPIAFVAVNSGTPAPLVAQYARSVGLTWPVIVDLDRSFESACKNVGVGEISLQNVMKVAYITADGKVYPGNYAKLDDTIERALKGASWHIDPSEIPEELWPVWRSIEFAQYAPAAQALAKARNSRKAEVKAAAAKLAELVDRQAADDLTAAKAETSKVRAYQQYAAIARRFAGYPAASEAVAAGREIAKDPAYRKELAVVKQVERQRALANSPTSAVRERATAAIKRIISEHPDSEAARLGRQILESQAIFQQ
jgi:thiol-disulfide isomerase/thioredoxin